VVELRFGEGDAALLDGLAGHVEVLAGRRGDRHRRRDRVVDALHARVCTPRRSSCAATLEDVFLRLTGRRLID
jgi:hypothetical protein